MKGFLYLVFFAVLLSSFSSCKKCYTCTNQCTYCSKKINDSTTTIQKLCSDTVGSVSLYNSQVGILKKDSFICTSSPSTVTQKFCVNSAGETPYQTYYNSRLVCK